MKNNLKVRQSNNLIESPYSQDFSIHEIKLFEIALSEIKQEDLHLYETETNKKFTYSNVNLAHMLKTSTSTISHEIENTASRIMKKAIHLRKELPDGSIEFEMINIMPYARYKDGVLDFQINYQIIPYLIQLNSNFTEFNLGNLLSMNSSYGIKLYKLLYQYKNIKFRKFLVNELKEQFGLSDKYPQYKDFKRRVLEPSIQQINKLTDLNVVYTEIKFSRKVEQIEFKFELKEKLKLNDSIDRKKLIKDEVVYEDEIINNLEVSNNTKKLLIELLEAKGNIYVKESINYAKKNAKSNFEKYLLDTISNDWAQNDINKKISKLNNEQKKQEEKQFKNESIKKQQEKDNLNKSEIENLFYKLSEKKQSFYIEHTNIILNKLSIKLKTMNINEESLVFSVFAVSEGKSYDKLIESYIEKVQNLSLSIKSI